MSTLEPDSIHIDLTLQSTSYETGPIHFDHVRTMNLHRCDRAKGCYLFMWLAAPSFINPVDLRKCCFGLLLYLLLRLCKKKMTKAFGTGIFDHKKSRNETEAARRSEKVVKVRIVVTCNVNTCSVWDEQYVSLFYTPRTARHFVQPCSSNESNCHVMISFLVKTHFRSTSNPPTRGGLPALQSGPHKSTHTKTRTSVDKIELDLIAIRSWLKR